MKTETKRKVRALRALAEFPAQDEDNYRDAANGCDWDEAGGRFLLVEYNRRNQQFWASRHATAESAAEFHDTQEYGEDWGIAALFDLDNGDRFDGVTKISFVAYEDLRVKL